MLRPGDRRRASPHLRLVGAALAAAVAGYLTYKALDWSSGGCDCYDRILPEQVWIGAVALAAVFYGAAAALVIAWLREWTADSR